MQSVGTGSADASPPDAPLPSFRLYVSMTSPLSLRAIGNARAFLSQAFPDGHKLAVLNLAEHVHSARADQIVAAPTLLRLWPLPHRRLIGDLSDTQRMRKALGLPGGP